MHQEWLPGQLAGSSGNVEPWLGQLLQECRPSYELAEHNQASALWSPPAPANLPTTKDSMQLASSVTPEHYQDLYAQTLQHWKESDDRMLSPYMNDLYFQDAASSSPNAAGKGPQVDQQRGFASPPDPSDVPEDIAYDFQLIENLEMPSATPLTRSDSAHALGEAIDPELLPDLEALTESFELPPQLRPDTVEQPARPQAPQSSNSYQPDASHPYSRHDVQHGYRASSSQPGPGLLNSGATPSSGPASTASDDSGDPSRSLAARQHSAQAFDDLQYALANPGALPLLDVDVDALTDQQAAYMLDENQELWDLMQQDEVAELDTSAALEGLDLASSMPSPAVTSALSPEADQPPTHAAWANPASQGVGRPSSAQALAELDWSLPNKRKGKGGRQPAMDPRLDPNVDPKRAKRILANRLSAARSKMKQKSQIESLRRQITVLEGNRKELKGSVVKAKAACEAKANDNKALQNQIKELEERCQQQALMTTRLLEKRSGTMSFHGSQPLNLGLTAVSGPCCKADMPVERRNRSTLPPSSRNARQHQVRAVQPAIRGQKLQEQTLHGAGDYDRSGMNAQQPGQFHQDALKSWGSTGKRQPARPRPRS